MRSGRSRRSPRGSCARVGVEPAGEFVAFVDIGVFADTPRVAVPAAPRVIFVGVLERYKNLEGLAAAWRLVAARVPGAELHLVGNGTLSELVESLVAEGIGVRWDRRLEPPELAAAVDEARALVLPSASEGLPRIVIESFVRGRAVIGASAGGIPDIVEDGVNGLLVPAGDTEALAAALERVLDRRRSRRSPRRRRGRIGTEVDGDARAVRGEDGGARRRDDRRARSGAAAS